jgi:hypothetical protein
LLILVFIVRKKTKLCSGERSNRFRKEQHPGRLAKMATKSWGCAFSGPLGERFKSGCACFFLSGQVGCAIMVKDESMKFGSLHIRKALMAKQLSKLFALSSSLFHLTHS